jgi:hypothetical protein
VLEDRGDDRLHLVAAGHVEPLERSLRRGIGDARDEIAPELADEEARMVGMRDREADGVFPGERSALVEDRLDARVVELRSYRKLTLPAPLFQSFRKPVRAGLLTDV